MAALRSSAIVKHPFRFLLGLVVLLSISIVIFTPAHAAGTVTDCSSYGPAAGTLQAALAGGGTVTFSCSGTIIVPEIGISSAVTIDATGQNVHLDGNNANGVFTVNAGGSLTLIHVTVQNGNAMQGGGIRVDFGSATLTNSIVSGSSANSGGGIWNQATLTLTNSTVSGNTASATAGGGGIYNSVLGTATLTNSTVSGNAASDGGGILNNNMMTLTNSIVSGNTSTGAGGGIDNGGTLILTKSTISGNSAPGVGGGINNDGGTITITNSTFANNSSCCGGGTYNGDFATLTVTNSTFSGNSGYGIQHTSSSTPNVGNSILYGNAPGDCLGSLNHTAPNLGCGGSVTGNPLLGAFTGSPAHFPLLAASPAIDTGDNGICPATDQTGAGRPFDGDGNGTATCDLGAIEAQFVSPALSISDVTAAEGTGGTTTFTFAVSLNLPAASGGVTFDIATADNSATTADSDYVAKTLTGQTIAAGSTGPYNFSVTVNADAIAESDESFFVNVTNIVGAFVSDSQGVGTITNDDTSGIIVDPTGGLITTEAGGTADFTVVLSSQPIADVTINLLSSNPAEGTVPASITFTTANWDVAQTVTVTGVDDTIADGDIAYTIITSVSTTDPVYAPLDPADVSVTNQDDETADIAITPTILDLSEGGSGSYQIQFASTPSSPVTLEISFDPAQVSVNGAASPVSLIFTDTTPQTVSVLVLANPNDNADRTTLITHAIIASAVPVYPVGMALPSVTVHIHDAPPPPPSPTCDTENFDENGVVRTGIPDAMRYAINCRALYHNNQATTWLGSPLYSEANLGVAGLLNLGVMQAVDIFSPPGMTYFEGGVVFCLRGEGTLIWLAASGVPRHAEIIGSYPVPEFSGFTCATLFEPGTLVLVRDTPAR